MMKTGGISDGSDQSHSDASGESSSSDDDDESESESERASQLSYLQKQVLHSTHSHTPILHTVCMYRY